MGHILTESCPDLTPLEEPFKEVWQAGVSAAEVPLAAMSPMNAWLASQTGSAGEYLRAVAKMQIVSRQIITFFDKFDLLLLPVLMHSPMKVGEWEHLSPPETLAKVIAWMTPNPLANATGLPAIAPPHRQFRPPWFTYSHPTNRSSGSRSHSNCHSRPIRSSKSLDSPTSSLIYHDII